MLRIATLVMGLSAASLAQKPFVVRVVDDATGRGVPLVELRTQHYLRYVTDSGGVAAIAEPGLMGQEVLFHVSSHGYQYEGHAFGDEPSVVLRLQPGAGKELKVHRVAIAERFYRVTGAGIYQDTVAAGMPPPIRKPLWNAGVLGQDTVVTAPYRGRLFWIWGDTILPAGFNFAVSGATSRLPGKGGLDPSVGVDLEYFTGKDGLSKPMLPLPGGGLVWIEGLFPMRDPAGEERLIATYTRQHGLKPPEECGVAVYRDEGRVFEPWFSTPCPEGHVSSHPFLREEGGRQYWYLYPTLRVPNDWKAVQDPRQWESFTCVRNGAKLDRKKVDLDRDAEGRPHWRWVAGAARLDPADHAHLLTSGAIRIEDARFALLDVAGGKPTGASPSCAVWSRFRQRWILLAERSGDVFYSEAERPEGPWRKAIRILHHDNYTFYNVAMHPYFEQEDGRVIYFEGTYTESFSKPKSVTARYNYNQILYRLRLDDPHLQPVR